MSGFSRALEHAQFFQKLHKIEIKPLSKFSITLSILSKVQEIRGVLSLLQIFRFFIMDLCQLNRAKLKVSLFIFVVAGRRYRKSKEK